MPESIDPVFSQNKDTIDLVLLDMVMPKMNGPEVFEAIRACDPSAKVIATSGFAKDVTTEELIAKGLCGFMKKPYRRARLSKVVAEVLGTGVG